MSDFEDFLRGIARLGGTVEIAAGDEARMNEFAKDINRLTLITPDALAELIHQRPEYVGIMGLSVRLSQEQLKNVVRHRFGSAGLVTLARNKATELIEFLDQEFGLVAELEMQRGRAWTFADMLVERFSSRLRAGGAIHRGRSVEDEVEAVAEDLGLPRSMRTTFVGRANQTAPCDMAVPRGGEDALVVVGIKGFDSTGSKLTDASREVQAMANVRRPNQYVFVVADGIGWLSRQADLRRIYRLWETREIDGLFNLSTLDQFRLQLMSAAGRVGLL